MYPFTNDNTYLKNCWYVAATSQELDDGPIERVIMDQPVALFKMADGTPAAMHGVCPHRYYPLAKGRVVDDAIECGYHGFRFDGRTGSCVKVPFQSSSPRSFHQRVYPTREHGGWIWIWTGETEKADPALLPPVEDMGTGPGWTVQIGPCLHGAGRAQLLVENLLDLTHIEFLHASTLQAEGALDFPVRLREEQDRLYATRLTRTGWIDGFYDLIYGSENRFDGQHDAIGDTWYWSPAYLRTGLSIHRIDGQEEVDRSLFGLFYFQHFITPETQHSCHYFAGMSRNYKQDDERLSTIMMAKDIDVRHQDIEAIGLVEQQLSRPWTLRQELLVQADKPAVQVRRKIQKLLDEEATLSASVDAAA